MSDGVGVSMTKMGVSLATGFEVGFNVNVGLGKVGNAGEVGTSVFVAPSVSVGDGCEVCVLAMVVSDACAGTVSLGKTVGVELGAGTAVGVPCESVTLSGPLPKTTSSN